MWKLVKNHRNMLKNDDLTKFKECSYFILIVKCYTMIYPIQKRLLMYSSVNEMYFVLLVAIIE